MFFNKYFVINNQFSKEDSIIITSGRKEINYRTN